MPVGTGGLAAGIAGVTMPGEKPTYLEVDGAGCVPDGTW